MLQKVSQAMVDALKDAGVCHIFGIPSIHNIGFYNALRNEPAIRHILCRHEGSATHMADGYARSGKGVGVVMASTGPGAAYTLSPLLEAYCSCSPVLMMTSNVRLNQIDRGYGVLHEIKQQHTAFSAVTKKTFCLDPGSDIQEQVTGAIDLATSGRPGPVYLEVPNDLWDLEVDTRSVEKSREMPKPDMDKNLSDALALLKWAKQPLIIAGIESVHTGLGKDILKLAEMLHAPVLTDSGGKGIVPEDHPLSFGNVTNGGVVKKIHETCDVTLVIGSRLRYVDFKRRGISLPGLIHMDWDETWVDKNFTAKIKLIGDVKALVSALASLLSQEDIDKKRKTTVASFQKEQQAFRKSIPREKAEVAYVDALRGAIPDDGLLVVDNTMIGYFAEQLYLSKRPLGLVPAKGASPIGFAFPAAMGLKLAVPETPVVALIGDGGFFYGGQELATCMQHGIGFPVIVVNDGAYRMIDYLQQNTYQAGYQTTLLNPDFTVYAQSFGVTSMRVNSPEGLSDAVKKALALKKMVLIELNASFPDPPFGQF